MIKIIFAQSANKIIGKDNKLPWNIGRELQIFKDKTINSSILMGRKTFDSLPSSVKPLPGRKNFIVSSDPTFNYPGIHVINKPIDFILEKYSSRFNNVPNEDLWVIGGLQIYKLAMQYADEIHVTEIMKNFEGDTYAPAIDLNVFVLTNSSEVITDNISGIDFYISIYKRR